MGVAGGDVGTEVPGSAGDGDLLPAVATQQAGDEVLEIGPAHPICGGDLLVQHRLSGHSIAPPAPQHQYPPDE